MGAVRMRLRAEARARWRGWLGLALLVGLASGASIAAAAGALRTETAYPRFVDSHAGYDLQFGGTADGRDINAESAKIMALPQVAAATRVRFAAASTTLPDGRVVGFPDFVAVVDPAGKDGVSVNRWKILEGRALDPNRPDEALVPFNTLEKLGLHVGEVLQVHIGDPFADPATAPSASVRIVGVILAPGGMPVVGSVSFAGAQLSPAFAKAHGDQIPPFTDGPAVLLKHRSDVAPFLAAVAKIDPVIDIPSKLTQHLAGVRRTLRFEVLALWALAALVAIAGFAIIGQSLARQVYLGAEDHPSLRSLGMDRPQLAMVSLVAATGIALAGAVVAGVVAYAASWLTPIGLARIAEPSPGFAFNPIVYASGVAATLMAVVVATSIPAWRAAGQAWMSGHASSVARSGAAAKGLPVATATGIRMALRGGRRGDAVPVRSAVLGTTIGIGALVAALVFGSSLHRLIATPRLAGYSWDTTITTNGPSKGLYNHLANDPDVAAFSKGGIFNVLVAKKYLQALIYEAAKPIRPAVVEGRAPMAVDEVALGGTTMRAAHTRVGGTARIEFPADPVAEIPGAVSRTVEMRVVGRVVIPPFFFQAGEPGEGVAMTLEAAFHNGPSHSPRVGMPALVQLKPGVDLDRWLAGYKKAFPDLFTINKREPGAELLSLGRVSSLPLALAGVLAVLAAGALAHALLTSIQRRRRELAILKALGFVGSQVRGAVRWQSLTMTIVALVIGMPAGIAVGRWLWLLFAGDIGVVPSALVPALAVVVAPAALFLAALIAALPARSAARTQPAVILRTE